MLTPVAISLHRCKNIRVDSHTPTNANAITLIIRGTAEDEETENILSLVMFGLPEFVTKKLMEAFQDSETLIHD